MTLTEAQAQFNDLADRLSAAKAAQKAALAAFGRNPTDVWDTYPDELRAVTGGTGNYQESKTVTADPAGMTILPDEGYSGMLKAIIAAEPNFQSYNLVEGIEAWGITGTAKPATTSDAPSNLPVGKDDADTAYETQSGAAPTETDYFVCVDNDGNITYWYLSDDFTITSYDPITTEFKATGAIRMAYHTTGESAGTWTLDDFTSAESGGWNYLENIRSCTREKLYYNDVEIWPNSPTMWSYNGTVLPALPSWDRAKYPYAVIDYDSAFDVYTLICTDKKLTWSGEAFIYDFEGDGYYFGALTWAAGYSWKDDGTDKYIDGFVYDGEANMSTSKTGVIWSNHDVISRVDGGIHLAASNPVPMEVN